MPKDITRSRGNATPSGKHGTNGGATALGSIAKSATAGSEPLQLKPIDRVYADDWVDGVLRECGVAVDSHDARRKRYWLQDVSQAVMAVFTDKKVCNDGIERDVTRYKVCQCKRMALGVGQHDTVAADLTARGAVYRLMSCKSVWHCPVCSAVISMRRARLVLRAIKAAAELGYVCLLATYTARHDALTDLQVQYEAMTKAHRRVWSGGDIKAIKARFGVLGLIRNLEVTYSRVNGWHTHIHELVFVRKEDLPEVQEAMLQAFDGVFRERWERFAGERGLTMNEHGFDVTCSTQRVADYVAKFGHDPRWREADELTKWQKKTGCGWEANAHLTPWQLLEFAGSGFNDYAEEAARLFREYAVVFHGKKQLHWSEELKKKLGVTEETDEEAFDQEEQENQKEAPVLFTAYIPRAEFRRVAAQHRRAQLLEVIELGDPDVIGQVCYELFGFRPQIEGGFEV